MDKIEEILTRGVVNIIPSRNELEKLLRSEKKLNVYLGVDPTRTKIHLGHAVPLRKLQAFAELGHNVTFLIGDFTALIGDTSDKDSERPILTREEIQKNFKTYKKQAGKILDFSKIKVRLNSEWLSKLTFEEIVNLTQHFSLGDFVNRELIKKRLNLGKRVRLDETLYPVMQGYDSYFMNTDVQIGSADQTFNMQAGRTLIKEIRNKESFILVTDYLVGTDGRKMSKSWGNAIWLEDEPNQMFGKIMSIKDEHIIQYFLLATNLPLQQIKRQEDLLKKGENPMTVKLRLAATIVEELHGRKASKEAFEYFEKTFRENQPEYNLSIPLKKDLASTIAPFTTRKSISEAKRLILQGAIDVNGKTITNPLYPLKIGDKIKIGQKVFATVVKK